MTPSKSAPSGSGKTSRAKKVSKDRGGPVGGTGVQPAPNPLVTEREVPNVVTDSNKRSSNDVLMGHFATVTDGEHQGRTVVTERPVEFDKNGWPKTVLCVTRDAANEHIVVPYDSLAPTKAHRQ